MVLYAVWASDSAFEAALLMYSAPVNTPGGKPVIEFPFVPMSPIITVGPVFVIVAALRAPKVAAVPRSICNGQMVCVKRRKDATDLC